MRACDRDGGECCRRFHTCITCWFSPLWQNVVVITERPNSSKGLTFKSNSRWCWNKVETNWRISSTLSGGKAMSHRDKNQKQSHKDISHVMHCGSYNSRKIWRLMKKLRLCLQTGICPKVKKPNDNEDNPDRLFLIIFHPTNFYLVSTTCHTLF